MLNISSNLKWLRKRLTWNYKYAIGKWNFMGQESKRYATIVNFIKDTKIVNPSILDLGCGYGSLYEYINENEISHYLGVDLSDTAIYKARKNKHTKSSFTVADIQKFETIEKFDIIIFNEVLYYLDNPFESVIRFDANFKKNGFYIFSFYGERNDLKEMLAARYELIKNEVVIKEINKNWGINLFKVNN